MPADSTRGGWQPPLSMTIVSSVLAGLIGACIICLIDPVFAIDALPELPIEPSDEQIAAKWKSESDFYGRNAALDMAILAGLLGMSIGAGTVSRARVQSGLAGGAVAAVAAATSAYITGRPIGWAMLVSEDQSLVQSGMLMFAVWGALAVGMAIAIGFVQGGAASVVQSIISAIISAIFVVIAHTIVFAIAFPSANLIFVVPNSTAERVVWGVTCCTVLGLGMAIAMRTEKKLPNDTPELDVGTEAISNKD